MPHAFSHNHLLICPLSKEDWLTVIQLPIEYQISVYLVDMFPCTAGVDLFPCCVDIQGIVSTHVETVCLLSKLKSSEHIYVDINLDELDLTKADDSKQPGCTKEKEDAIAETLKHFGMI